MRTQFDKEESALGVASGRSTPLPVGHAPSHGVMLDPRALVTVVMERLNVVNARKDELALAIHSLADIAQQLTQSYVQQRLAIEQLRRRVKALESAATMPASAPRDQAPSAMQ